MKRRSSSISNALRDAREDADSENYVPTQRPKLGESTGNKVNIFNSIGAGKRGSLAPLPSSLKPPASPSIPNLLSKLGTRVDALERLPAQFETFESAFTKGLESAQMQSRQESEALSAKTKDLASRMDVLEAQTSSSLSAQKAEAAQLVESAKAELASNIEKQAATINAKFHAAQSETQRSMELIATTTAEQLANQNAEIGQRLRDTEQRLEAKVDELQAENAHALQSHERNMDAAFEQHRVETKAEILEATLSIEVETNSRSEAINQLHSALDGQQRQITSLNAEHDAVKQSVGALRQENESAINEARAFTSEVARATKEEFQEAISSTELDLNTKITKAQEAVVESHLNAMGKIDNFALRMEGKLEDLSEEQVEFLKAQLKEDTFNTVKPLAKAIAPALVREIDEVINAAQEKLEELHDADGAAAGYGYNAQFEDEAELSGSISDTQE